MFRLSTCIALVALLLAVLWQPTVSDDKLVDTHEEVLLVTAHPDDECMFFAPTILSLIARNVSVHSLCLSVGNMDGLGDVRTKELAASLDILGIPQMNRRIIDHSYAFSCNFAGPYIELPGACKMTSDRHGTTISSLTLSANMSLNITSQLYV